MASTRDVPVVVGSLADDDFVTMLGGELARVQRIARLLVGDPDEADDLVAEAIARTLPRWRAGAVDDCPAYLRRVMVNLASRRWRRRAMGRQRDHHALDWLAPMVDTESTATGRDLTLRALAKLPARRRAVVVLRFYDDLSEAAIAGVLDISLGTVKSQLSRALEQLRRDLATLEES